MTDSIIIFGCGSQAVYVIDNLRSRNIEAVAAVDLEKASWARIFANLASFAVSLAALAVLIVNPRTITNAAAAIPATQTSIFCQFPTSTASSSSSIVAPPIIRLPTSDPHRARPNPSRSQLGRPLLCPGAYGLAYDVRTRLFPLPGWQIIPDRNGELLPLQC